MNCNHYNQFQAEKRGPMSKYGLGIPLYLTANSLSLLYVQHTVLDRISFNSFLTKKATCEATLPHLLEPASVVTVCST